VWGVVGVWAGAAGAAALRRMLYALVLVVLVLVVPTGPAEGAGPFGLATDAPPAGWRSWNSMGARVTQAKMEAAMEALAKKRSDGHSLADLGYVTAGLDDAWQACGTGVDGSFHGVHGEPLVNTTTFPDLGAMVKKAHGLGLKAGFYINNCICGENQWRGNRTWEQVVYQGTVNAIVNWGFDGCKIDSCSEFTNMSKWAELFNTSGKPMLLENCHNSDGQDPCPEAKACPESGVCPYNLWRLGRDIGASWGSVYSNLQDTIPWNKGSPSLSRPGRWGYPDMMQVGQLASFEEDRAHFGAWAIVSSPLTLGYDLTDDRITERLWPIISNRLALSINRAWAGSPGKLVAEVSSTRANASFLRRRCGGGAARACCVHHDGPPNSPPRYDGTGNPPLCGTQIWVKPLSTTNGSVAVLLLNNQDTDVANVSLKVAFATVLSDEDNATSSAILTDVWGGSSVRLHRTDSFESGAFGGHDSKFFVLTPVSGGAPGPRARVSVEQQRAAPGIHVRSHDSSVVSRRLPSCEERCAGAGPGGDATDQPQFHHCCVGLNSTGQTPSCAMGCLMGRHTGSLHDCRASCRRAHGQCTYSSAATGGASLNLCGSCATGVAGDCRARFASGPWGNLNASACDKSFNRGACNITGSTCVVQTVEDWAPVRGCSLGGCFEGCAFAQGCARP
jgi:hypothetical protein